MGFSSDFKRISRKREIEMTAKGRLRIQGDVSPEEYEYFKTALAKYNKLKEEKIKKLDSKAKVSRTTSGEFILIAIKKMMEESE